MEVTVSYRYSNKVDSAKDAPWEGAEVSITATVDADNKDKAIEELFKEVKLQTWAELGVQFNQDEENGTLKPVNIIHEQPAKRTFTPRPQGTTSRDNGMDLRTKHPMLPTFEFNGATYIDFREAKLDGSVSPKHPDFKSIDNKDSQWIFGKEGNESVFYSDLKQANVLVGANS